MKKLLFLLFFVSQLSFAGGRDKEPIGNITSTWLTGLTSSTQAVIVSGGTGNANCLDYLVGFSTNTYTLTVLDGNTTSYQIPVPASVVHVHNFTPGLCGTNATAMTIKNVVAVGSTTVHLNYKGYIGR